MARSLPSESVTIGTTPRVGTVSIGWEENGRPSSARGVELPDS